MHKEMLAGRFQIATYSVRVRLFAVRVSSRFPNEFSKASTPCDSSKFETSSKLIPSSSTSRMTWSAASKSTSTVLLKVPWSTKASSVASGRVLTVLGPIKEST